MILDVIWFFVIAMIVFQAGWMIDFAYNECVSLPWGFSYKKISGTRWFEIAIFYLFGSMTVLFIMAFNVGNAYLIIESTIAYILEFLVLLAIMGNFSNYKKNMISLALYGQYWNLYYYYGVILPMIVTVVLYAVIA